jgi:hypothetical protein
MNVRTVARCFTSSFGWLILTCGALYFVYFAQLMVVVSPTTSDQQQQLPASFSNHLLAIGSNTQQVVVNRSRCCVMSGRQQQTADVCGRPNCTRNCPDPVQIPSIDDSSRANAFFLETSGSGGLNIRQACAVESLAFHNPDLTVNVFFMMDDADDVQQQKQKQIKNKSSKVLLASKTVRQLKEKYRNIQFAFVSLGEFIAGTLLEKWFHCTDWRKGPYHVAHLSDGLRFLTLNKYGGYYFDLDVLMVRPVTYYSNFVATPDDHNVASNSIHADLNNPVMELALQNFVSNYRQVELSLSINIYNDEYPNKFHAFHC